MAFTVDINARNNSKDESSGSQKKALIALRVWVALC
jgi:hypothetical protein